MNETCRHCGQPLTMARGLRGFQEWVHASTKRRGCPGGRGSAAPGAGRRDKRWKWY